VAMHRIHHAKSDQSGRTSTLRRTASCAATSAGCSAGSGWTGARWSGAGPRGSCRTRPRVLNRYSRGSRRGPRLAFYAWAAGRSSSGARRPPQMLTLHDVVRELGRPHLGLTARADEGGLAQPLVGRPPGLGEAAQHHHAFSARPPRLRPELDMTCSPSVPRGGGSRRTSTCCRRTPRSSASAAGAAQTEPVTAPR